MTTLRTRQILILCQVHFFLQRVLTRAVRAALGQAPITIARAVSNIECLLHDRRLATVGITHAAARIADVRSDLWVMALRPVVLIARHQLSDIPELGALKLPRRHANVAELINAAYVMADVVSRHHVAFTKAGLGEYASQNLRSFGGVLAEKVDARNGFRQALAADTAAIALNLQQGHAAIRQVDIQLVSSFSHLPLMLGIWRNAKRVAGAEVTIVRRRAASKKATLRRAA